VRKSWWRLLEKPAPLAIYDAQFNAHAFHVDLLHRIVFAPPQKREDPPKKSVAKSGSAHVRHASGQKQLTRLKERVAQNREQTTSEQSGFKVERIP